MKMHLNLEFDSIEELHDWVAKTAETLSAKPQVVVEPEATLGATLPVQAAQSTEPAPKPKRKRRSKAEMAAARAAEAAAKPVPAPVKTVTEPEPAEEVPPGNGKDAETLERMKKFQAMSAKNVSVALNVLDEFVEHPGSDKFSDLVPEKQAAVLSTLEERLG